MKQNMRIMNDSVN